MDFLFNKLEDVPFLPINLFKDLNLNCQQKFLKFYIPLGLLKIKIFLDKFNAQSQSKALNKIMSEFLGKERLPMLIVDKKIKYNKNEFNTKIVQL